MEFSLLELTTLEAIVEGHCNQLSQNRKWFHQKEMSKKILAKVSKAIEDETSRLEKEERKKQFFPRLDQILKKEFGEKFTYNINSVGWEVIPNSISAGRMMEDEPVQIEIDKLCQELDIPIINFPVWMYAK